MTAGMTPASHHSMTVVRLTPNRRATVSGVNLRSIEKPLLTMFCGQGDDSDWRFQSRRPVVSKLETSGAIPLNHLPYAILQGQAESV